ncbi:hypothetical protein BT69DRAFT_1330865 [Atractiella rhizophila]|nr:hypothetical protein BT69DRAFT_1330865 [Atractiella rhizophila]
MTSSPPSVQPALPSTLPSSLSPATEPTATHELPLPFPSANVTTTPTFAPESPSTSAVNLPSPSASPAGAQVAGHGVTRNVLNHVGTNSNGAATGSPISTPSTTNDYQMISTSPSPSPPALTPESTMGRGGGKGVVNGTGAFGGGGGTGGGGWTSGLGVNGNSSGLSEGTQTQTQERGVGGGVNGIAGEGGFLPVNLILFNGGTVLPLLSCSHYYPHAFKPQCL